MSNLPIMPMYIGDMIADTVHLSPEVMGCYHLLLYWQWWHQAEPLSDDDVELARICRMTPARWRRVARPKLEHFFDIRADGWHNRRMAEEYAKATEKAARSRKNGKAGGRPPKKPRRQPARNPRETQLETQTETQTEPGRNPEETQTVTQTVTQTEPGTKATRSRSRSIKEDDDDDGARAGRGIDWDGETDPTALARAIRPRDPSVIDPDPAIAEAAVMGAAMFLAARNRRWPRHPTPSAPHLTLMAECAGFARRGASPDVMAAVFERGMDDESRSGAGPPTSAAFRRHQVDRQIKDLRRLRSQEAGDGIDIVGVGDGPRPRSWSGGGNPYTAAIARAVAGLAD